MKKSEVWVVAAVLALLLVAVFVFRATRSGEAPGLAPLEPVPASERQPGPEPDSSRALSSGKPGLVNPGEDAMTPSLISKAQAKLGQEGFYEGAVDGEWNRELSRAIRDFQRSRGLRITGLLDGNTRAALAI